MSPFVPHFASECLSFFTKEEAKWPRISAEELIENNIKIVSQGGNTSLCGANVPNSSEQNIEIVGDSKILVYNSPYKIVFRRNEILIPISYN